MVNEIELPENPGQTFEVKYIDEKTYIFDSKRIYEFTQSGQLNEVLTLNINNYIIHNQSKFTWLFNNNQWALYSSNHTPPKQELIGKLKLFGTLRYIDVDTNGYIWLINDENLLLKLTPVGKSASSDFVLRTIKIQSGQHELELNSSINLDARNNNLKTKLSAPFYLLQNGVNFSYKIEGLNDDWSDWSNNSELNYGFIPAGNYALKYKAKNALGMESDEQTILINVPKPFTQTTLFYLILIVVFGAIAYLVMKLRIQKLKKDKEILEQKVKERTATIELQKSRIEKQHDEITGSIRYAKRIQTAMLPHDEIIEAMLPDHFILFNPRDIVSGDFYFFKPVGNKVAFVAADCTGHGVPGGFMSMVGMSFLGEITSQLPTPTASRIVDHLRDKIKLTLGQNEVDSTQKDGMDLAICIIDFDNKQIQYAGAFNPLIMIRDGELEVIKADRQPVAVYVKESVFTNHIIDVRPGDSFYMFSDGFPDQIGGPKQRKFMSKNFKDLLLKHHNLPMPEQKKLYQQALKDWIGDGMQVDDILVIGFRL